MQFNYYAKKPNETMFQYQIRQVAIDEREACEKIANDMETKFGTKESRKKFGKEVARLMGDVAFDIASQIRKRRYMDEHQEEPVDA